MISSNESSSSDSFAVTISVHARYLAFRLAEGLNDRELLEEIYTIYPKFKMSSYRIPRKRIHNFPLLGALKFLNRRVGNKFSDDRLSNFFSFLVTQTLRRPPQSTPWIFHGFSGYCEAPLKKAKKLGAITVIERGCPHIDEQLRLIAEEKSKLLDTPHSPHLTPVHERMKREYEIADYIKVPSRYSQRSFLERGFSPEKVIVVHDCNEKPTSYTSASRDLKKFTVLCTGGDFYRKGLIYLLQAWKKLNLSDAELIFKGAVPKKFEHLLDADNITRITRHLSDEEMTELYNKAHIFVLPSIDEGFGLVVAEAMTAGLPVVVTQNVGSADNIEDGKEGFVVPIRSSDALADKIRFFYDNPERVTEMSAAALKKSKFYSLDPFMDRMVKAYTSMLTTR